MTRTHNQWIAPVGAFAISTGGLSRTTILKRGGIPIARFYADRFDQALLDLIVAKLNAPDSAPELYNIVSMLASFDARNNTAHLRKLARDALAKVDGK